MRGTVTQIANEIRRRGRSLKTKTDLACRQSLRQGKTLAKAASKGTYKQVTLTAMGHPYATRRPNPPADPAILNYQTGNLFRSWNTRNLSTGNFFMGQIFNTSPEAEDIEQRRNPRVIERPLVAYVSRQLQPIFRRNVAKAVREAI